MSFFQPLITTAFSNYGLMRSSYLYRDADMAVGGVAGKRDGGGVDKVNENSNLPKTKNTIDRDAGKIKSGYGDILDISAKGKAAAEALEKTKLNNNETKNIETSNIETSKTESINADSSNVKTNDSHIEIANSTHETNGVKSTNETSETSETSDEEKLDSADELASGKKLTAEEEEQVRELKERDAEVRQHEAAHIAVAGQYAQGGAKYTYQTGPDGKKYAIGGSVSIDVSEVEGDPEATIAKMQQVAAAATAPAEPSNQDLKVAAAAKQTEAKARNELAKNKTENNNTENNNTQNNNNNPKSNINAAYNQNSIQKNTNFPTNKINVFA
ncbi:MAG: hypothetical protein LBP59_15895 [Planctomycetaceae bacterium]|jgi:hypothetical protein|nr:hypothetical protein [Planctomycetaceae bacterium]